MSNENTKNMVLIQACQKGNLSAVKNFFKENPDFDIHHDDDITLKLACFSGNLELVQYLLTSPELKEHANIHAKHKSLIEYTPLLTACKNNHFSIVKYLLSSPELKEHASPREANDAALKYACIVGNLEMVQFLLVSPLLSNHCQFNYKKNAPIEKILRTPLEDASRNGHLDVVKYLLTSPDLKEKADLFFNNYGAFVKACKKGHLDIVQFLVNGSDLKQKVDIHAFNSQGLRCAAERGHLNVVQYLIGQGADYDEINKDVDPAVYQWVENYRTAFLEKQAMLVEKKSKINKNKIL